MMIIVYYNTQMVYGNIYMIILYYGNTYDNDNDSDSNQ